MRKGKVFLAGMVIGMAGSVSAGPVLPAGGTVVAGGATIGTGATRVDVVQTTSRSVINWTSFSIGTGGTVQFTQPATTSAVLNRVTGADPSSILGTLSANGQVFLMNPNGITVGPGGRVEAAGLVLTTASIADGDFMAGLVRVDAPPAGGTTLSIADGRIDAGVGTISVGMPGGTGLGGTPVIIPPTPPTFGGGTPPVITGGSITVNGGASLVGTSSGPRGGLTVLTTDSGGNTGSALPGGTIGARGTVVVATSPGQWMPVGTISVSGADAGTPQPVPTAPPASASGVGARSPAGARPAADVSTIADGAVTIRVPLVAASPVILN